MQMTGAGKLDTTTLAGKVANKATSVATQGKGKTLGDLLKSMESEIARALPKHLSVERLTRVALTQVRLIPDLQACDQMSFLAAIMQAAQLGLEPGINGQCYLIPFNNNKTGRKEVQFIAGYKGLLDVARRSGQIKSLTAKVVYENDVFDIVFGLEEKFEHKPALTNRGKPVMVYAYAHLADGGFQAETLTLEEVEAIRKRSKAWNNGPWVTDWAEMAKKTALRRLCKYLPASVELMDLLAADGTSKAEVSLDMAMVTPTDTDIIDADYSVHGDEPEAVAETVSAHNEQPEPELTMAEKAEALFPGKAVVA